MLVGELCYQKSPELGGFLISISDIVVFTILTDFDKIFSLRVE